MVTYNIFHKSIGTVVSFIQKCIAEIQNVITSIAIIIKGKNDSELLL